MVKEDDELKFKNVDFDFLLKKNIVTWFDLGINKLVQNDLKGAFQSFKALFIMIGAYDFSGKDTLDEVSELLTNHFESLSNGFVPKRKDVLMLRSEQKMSLIGLLDLFFSELTKAYAELGLWFSTRVESKDVDLLLSDENFNDSFSGVADKKAFLMSCEVDELLDCMPLNHLHDLFARVRVERVLKGKKEA